MEDANVPAILGRETILGFIGRAPKYRDVAIGEGEGTVRVGVMSGEDRDRFERIYTENKGVRARALVLCFTVINPDGTRVFTEDDIPKIAKLPSDLIDAAFKVAWKLNKIGEDEIKEEEKN